MDYITFGRTGLQASSMGGGYGKSSRIDQVSNKSKAESIAIGQAALVSLCRAEA